MSNLSAGEIGILLRDVLPEAVWGRLCSDELLRSLARYLELLESWNRVVSLTSVRSPAEVVRRHFAESLLCGSVLPAAGMVLDIGSGAGFPGIPVQLIRPGMEICLAESHARKAAFLREVVRELSLSTEVFSGRAQDFRGKLVGGVLLRAVDPMSQALEAAMSFGPEWVAVIGSKDREREYSAGLAGWCRTESVGLRGCVGGQVFLFEKVDVPRGTPA